MRLRFQTAGPESQTKKGSGVPGSQPGTDDGLSGPRRLIEDIGFDPFDTGSLRDHPAMISLRPSTIRSSSSGAIRPSRFPSRSTDSVRI